MSKILEADFTAGRGNFRLEIRLHLDKGILVLIGPSGSGKTTTLQCLAGLLQPVSGYIKLNGRTLYSAAEKINVPPRRRRIGYVFQDYALFPHMTVRQNVLYGLKEKSGESSSLPSPLELLRSFGIAHLMNRYPGQISGGEKQRVALARALAARPQLLLLDEPFCAVDRERRATLYRELRRLQREWEIPMVLVTHDEEDARVLGDIVITLPGGGLVRTEAGRLVKPGGRR